MLGEGSRSAVYLLRPPGPTLAAFTDHQPHRIHLCYRPTTNSPNKGLRFTNRDPDNGLQTRSGSPKALAPAPGLRTDPKGSYWRTFRRWRRTNPTGRLTNHFNKDAPVPDTQLLTLSRRSGGGPYCRIGQTAGRSKILTPFASC